MLRPKHATMSSLLDSTTIAPILSKAVEIIVEKLKMGKKLSADEVAILSVYLVYKVIKDDMAQIRAGISDVNKKIVNLNNEINEMKTAFINVKEKIEGLASSPP